MKILFYDYYRFHSLISGEIHGGFTKQLLHWLDGFSKCGYHVGLFVLKDQKSYLNNNFNNDCVFLDTYQQNKGIIFFRLFYIRIPIYYKTLKKYKPNFLFVGGPDHYVTILFLICKILKIKTIYRPTNDIEFSRKIYKRKNFLSIQLFKIGRRISDYIICQNDYQYRKCLKLFSQNRIIKIPNPINVNDIDTSFTKTDYVSWVGIFQKQKNLKLLIKIIKNCPHVKFKIAGKENKKNNEISHLVKELRELPNAEILGYISKNQIKKLLGKSFCHLNTSYYEGFPNTFLESWSVGTLVISPSNINPDSLITKYQLGAIYNNLDECTQSINNFRSINTNDYQKISLRLVNYIKQNHSNLNLTKTMIKYLNTDQF